MRTPKRCLKYDFARDFHYQIDNIIMPDNNNNNNNDNNNDNDNDNDDDDDDNDNNVIINTSAINRHPS